MGNYWPGHYSSRTETVCEARTDMDAVVGRSLHFHRCGMRQHRQRTGSQIIC